MFVLTVGVISSQRRRGRGKRKGQVTAKRALITNISVDVRPGKLSAPWASSWVDGIDQFPPGWQCGFSYGRGEEDITRRCCALSCKTGSRPSGAGKPLQQPAGVTPSRRRLHNRTDSAADHTLASLRPRITSTTCHSRLRGHPKNAIACAARMGFFPPPIPIPEFLFRFFSANAQTNAARKQRPVMKF